MASTQGKATAAKKKGPAQRTKASNAAKLTAEAKLKAGAADVRAAREAAKDMEVTAPSAWKGARSVEAVKLLLPSGNVCLAINRGLEYFLERGMIPNGLLQIMEDASDGKGLSPSQARELAADKEQLATAIKFMDEIVVACVVEPPISPLPQEGDDDFEQRDTSKLYVDQLDLMDKQFFMSWVMGGTRDLERFREEQASMLEAMEDVDGVVNSAE